jgi:uncharacterized protein YndB with AHSA1/START domain
MDGQLREADELRAVLFGPAPRRPGSLIGTQQPKRIYAHLHRVLATSPDKVYRAFLEPDALAKWLPPNGFACTVHHLEAKVGGSYRMSFRNFTTSQSHSFSGKYVELIPDQRLRYSDRFEDPNLKGEIQVTVTLRVVSVGTELNIAQDGLPDVIPLGKFCTSHDAGTV